MKVVGACLARTATNSLKIALEILLGAPCYHMWEAMEHPEHFAVWQRATEGSPPDWRRFLGGYAAAVDEPAAHFWREIHAAFPEAWVLLSVRDPDAWWQSCTQTVLPAVRRLSGGPLKELLARTWSADFGFDRYEEAAAKAGYRRFIDNVRANAPRDRLVEWHPGDGWGPLCEALGVGEPDTPFPHVNTTAEFQLQTPDRLRRLNLHEDG